MAASASGCRRCVRSLPGVMLWRSRYGLAGGCWGGGSPDQARLWGEEEPCVVAGLPRVGLTGTGMTRSHLYLCSRAGATATAWTVK